MNKKIILALSFCLISMAVEGGDVQDVQQASATQNTTAQEDNLQDSSEDASAHSFVAPAPLNNESAINDDELFEEYVVQNTPRLKKTNIITIRAIGLGVLPEIKSKARAIAIAKRAALIDGYRQLGEKMYGIKINAKDTIKDAMLKSSIIRTKVYALVKGAEVVDTQYDEKIGLFQVEMEVKLDGRLWSRALGHF